MAIRAGSSPEGAAQYAGIDRSTFYRWMDQGRRARSGPSRKFRDAIEKAKADLETMVAAKVIKGISEGKLDLAIQFLERRYPELWGRRDAVKVDGDARQQAGGGPVRIFLPPLRGDGKKGTPPPPDERRDEDRRDDDGDEGPETPVT
ncbi:MAG: hypothetical protein HYV09_03470 [Deltaproteobacteria bacterium]|nr:hypothetical protein [Deltaproteobacteria bacterium]